MAFTTIRLNDRISCIQETGVANFMRCNIWHVKGRDCDLVIDTGMGLNPLKDWILRETDRPIKAIGTHSHFDHSGSMHEFDCRLGHRAEADAFAQGGREATLYYGPWTEIEFVSNSRHPEFSSETYSITPSPLTGYLDEGDVVDLGDVAYQVLHLPGHSPGSIGLYNLKTKTLFSGDAIYDGELLDTHPHSDKKVYRETLERILSLGAEKFHAGHYPSFGQERMKHVISSYLVGQNAMPDVKTWFAESCAAGTDHFEDQDWSDALET